MSGGGTGVRCEALSFRYRPDEPAMRFDCAFAPGRVTSVMGPSGSGKSTLLALIAGFERAEGGRILIGDADVTRLPPARRPVSIVFQDNNLFAHLDVAANVGLGIAPDLRLDSAARGKLAEALDAVGLAGYETRKPGALSGGERQRVAIARALVRDRPVLMLDEAFGSLGPALRAAMLDLVADLHRRMAMTVIMVSHDPDDARRIASDLVFIDRGRVAVQGPTDRLLDDGENETVRAYLGSRQTPS